MNQKFDDIANEEDKKIYECLIVNYTIPLIVYFIGEKNEKYSIQCLLQDKVRDKIDSFFKEKGIYKYYYDDYYLIYENKKIKNYYIKIFYELISKDKIQNLFYNKNINNTIYITSSENLEKTNTTIINGKEKINDIDISVFPNNEIDERKIEIEIKVMKKCCCVVCRRKISDCCYRCNCRCPGSRFMKGLFWILCFVFSIISIILSIKSLSF